MLDLANAAEDAGVDRLVVSDHVVFGERLEEYGRPEIGGIEGGVQPTGPDGPWLEPLTVLSVVAGRTSRVRLATSVLQAALRRPIVLAKAAATLDVLSGGRLDLGVGIGWQREEYEAAGLEFSVRGGLLDETLEACRRLWGDPVIRLATADGRTVGPLHAMPKPAQPGGVPIWVSGTLNKGVLNRIVRFGSGWIPWGRFGRDPLAGVPQVREALSAAGRDPAGFGVRGQLRVRRESSGRLDVEATMAGVGELVAGGVTDFLIVDPALSIDPATAPEPLAELVAAFRVAATA
jgi:probable F420-dependent oxidoreductase